MMRHFSYPIIHLDTTDSTNLFAQELINAHSVKHFTIVSAFEQTKGRGQRGNVWHSQPGQNLTFSVILKPALLKVSNHFYLNRTFSLAICDFLKGRNIVGGGIKWPNDILVGGKKLAGILIENAVRGDLITSVIGGCGINVNQNNFDDDYLIEPVSLRLITGHKYVLDQLLQEVADCIANRFEQLEKNNFEEQTQAYHQLLYGLDKNCLFEKEGKKFNGVIKGTSEEGLLIVKTEKGTKQFNFGEIKFIQLI